MKKEGEKKQLHRMAKVNNFLDMWQHSQKLHAAKKESCDQTKQMTAVRYISDTEVILQAIRSVFQHDGAAVFEVSERSPLPRALSAKNCPGE
jgi:hypothetical protein